MGRLMRAAYLAHLQALLPVGDLWPRETSARLTALLSGLAEELARLSGRAADVRREADIRETGELLTDFERVLGPDPCGRDLNALTLADRQRIAHQRWTARGGQSRAYFRQLAERLGQTIEIEEFWPSDAGVLQAGADLVEDGEQYVWTVYLRFLLEHWFNAGEGVAGDPLGRLLLSDVECEIRRLAPAHTTPVFSYTLEREPVPGRQAAYLLNFLTNRLQARHPGRALYSAKATDALPVSRPSSAIFFDTDGMVRTAASHQARLDHNPLTRASRGLLLERAGTNLLPHSTNFAAASWNLQGAGVIVTPNAATALDGTVTATVINPTAAYRGIISNSPYNVQIGTNVAYSVFEFIDATEHRLRCVYSGGPNFGLTLRANGDLAPFGSNILDTGLVDLGRGRRMLWVAFRYDDTPSYRAVRLEVTGNDSAGRWVQHHAQLEAGAFPTSIIRTDGAPALRSADTLGVQLGGLLNPLAGTVLFEIEPLSMDGYPAIVEFTNAARTSIIDVLIHPHLPGLMARFVSPGSSPATAINSGRSLAGQRVRGAMAFDATGLTLCLEGRPLARLQVPVPPGLDRIALFTGNGRLSGHLRLFAYYPTRLADDELTNFSTSGA